MATRTSPNKMVRISMKNLLIEGCKKMAEENLKITKEFESIDNLDFWVW